MKDENSLVIQYKNLDLLVNGGKQITLNPKGEELLIKLLELQEKVETAIKHCKDQLAMAIQQVDPDLTSISADRVKVMYRVYGAKFGLNTMLIDELDPKLYTQKISYSPNSAEIEKVIKETGIIPNGIIVNDRSKTVSINLKGDNLEKIENI